jgi:hypothetical protein
MVQTIQRAFSSGEVSPALRQRADLTQYATGLAACINFIVKAEGGVASRPGLRYIGPLADHTKRGRLIPFSFNNEQTYILVFEHLKMFVIKDGAFVIDSTSPPDLFELTTPYTEAQLSRLIFTQDADVMTFTHPSHDPAYLTRQDHDDWSLDDINFASTVTAPGTLTLNSAGAGGGANNKKYFYVVTAVDDNDVESLPSASEFLTILSQNVTWGMKIDWADVPGAVYYRVYKDPSEGSGVYGWVGDTNVSQFFDYNTAPVTSDAPPANYEPFTDADMKPATTGYYQQRQFFANTEFEPLTVWASQSGIYNSLRASSPPRDDDSLEFTIKAYEVNEIRHILDIDGLVMLGAGCEYGVTDGVDEVLTPSTLGFKARTRHGASWCRPALTGDSAIYVVEKGARLRDIRSDFTGTDLSITARHLFDAEAPDTEYTIEEMTFAKEPYGIAWMIRSDGTLLGLTYLREHEVFGWHRHESAGGIFESVASISEDGRDAVYVIVKRVVNGATVRYVERMEKRYTDLAENAFCVDSGLSYDGVPAGVISGLDHLEGEEVAVLADGNEVTGCVVESGSVTLPSEASIVHVGLAYTPAIQLLDLDPNGSEMVNAKMKSVARVMINVVKTRGGFIGPVNDEGTAPIMSEIGPRFDSDGYASIALKTGKLEQVLTDGWNKSGAVRIEQRSPLPMEILSVVPDSDIS